MSSFFLIYHADLMSIDINSAEERKAATDLCQKHEMCALIILFVMMAVIAAIGALAATAVLLAILLTTGQSSTRMSNFETETQVNNTTNAEIIDRDGPPVQFILFSRDNPPINLNSTRNLSEMGFNVSNPTKIIIHGYLSSTKEEVVTLPGKAYLAQDEYNVIGMDWSALCEFEYFSARKGAQTAGKNLFYFLQFLVDQGVNYDDIHLIGHSLGAHVAAIGADAISGNRVGRITGLDPAGPGYSDAAHNLRLDPGDAKLVDVIHTYMRVLSLSEPLGHVDFYPNGGRYQPGCPDILDIWKIPESVTCNHGRAVLYFVESILNQNAFKSKRCDTVEDAIYARCFNDSDVYMGNENTYRNGFYYVKTKSEYPFSY